MQGARLVGWQDVSSVYKLPACVRVCVCAVVKVKESVRAAGQDH